MLLLRRKGPKAPFAPVTLILLFGKKKPAQGTDNGTVADSKKEAFPIPDILEKTITGNDVSKARDRLRLASLERDIIGEALTKIYEAEAKGQINHEQHPRLPPRKGQPERSPRTRQKNGSKPSGRKSSKPWSD